jgi:hypothetical protein
VTTRTPRGLFLGALAVLVFNDRVARPAGLLPAALNGKLSDLAVMLVAPAVLAALLTMARLRPDRAAVLAAALVGGIFAAIKLSAGAAHLFDGALSQASAALDLPVAARTTVDSTDLLVLPLVVAGAALARALARDPRWRRSAALTAGLLACSATSYSHQLVAPHWGFEDERLASTWATRLDGGAMLVRLGRHSDDGRFELDLQLEARETTLDVDLDQVTVELAGEVVGARRQPRTPAHLEALAPGKAVATLYFAPDRSSWAAPSRGTLRVPLSAGGRPHPVEVSLAFKERYVTWAESARRFGYHR